MADNKVSNAPLYYIGNCCQCSTLIHPQSERRAKDKWSILSEVNASFDGVCMEQCNSVYVV